MCKKTLILLLLGVTFFVSSCVDKTYDLANKEISTDVKIEGNKIALPVGDLKAIVLDSLIDIDAIEILDKNDKGVYSISMDSTISVKEGIDPITLNIDPIQHEEVIDFEKVNINNVQIDNVKKETAKFKTPTITLQELNEKLPVLTSAVDMGFVDDAVFEELEKLPENLRNIPIDETLKLENNIVPCEFEYNLPEQIETINSIKLGSEADPNGTLVKVVIANPRALHSCDKSISFKIDFPDMFKLSKNDNEEQIDKYKIDGNTITVTGLKPERETTSISFYITELCNIKEYINDGRIDIAEEIKYDIEYQASGEVGVTNDMVANDFKFYLTLESKLSFLDVAGKTKDIKVDFKPIEMKFDGDFDNLQHIDHINYVEFEEEMSHIKFDTQMEKDWLDIFKLKEGYALKISFPEQLTICPEHSVYEGKGKEIVYNEKEHAFYIYDLSILAKTHWELALQKLTLDIPVVNGHCHMDIHADIRFVSEEKGNEDEYFILAGIEMESLVDVLDKLNGEKEAVFDITESDLTIKDASVHTQVIEAELNTKTNFNLEEEIPSEIKRIENIGFAKDVEMTLDLKVIGLETLNTDIDLLADIYMPSFLKMETVEKAQGVDISEGKLTINTSYNPSSSEPFSVKLLLTGIDFMTEDFDFAGLTPKDSVDGKSYISYNKDIVVEGTASIHGTEFHSTVLENDIAFNVDFCIKDEIVVKTFHGIYKAEIEGVDEKIALDLGEELDFLKEEGNSITLADPQMEFVLTNTIGIPIDIELEITGRDKDGALIGEQITETLKIYPAEYDEVNDLLIPVETKMFLTTDVANNQKVGYDNYEIKKLANLLSEIPDSISFKVNPIIKEDATHHVDISDSIRLEGAYSVLVPLKFEDLRICYNDTIDGLQGSIGETLEMFSNVSLGLKMDIFNSMPLGLSLKMVPLDADDNVISDIEIDNLVIKAGAGGYIVNENNVLNNNIVPQKFAFAIKSKSGNLSSLDKLAMTIEATSNSTTGSAGLESGQGLKISNLVFEIAGDIEMDLSK